MYRPHEMTLAGSLFVGCSRFLMAACRLPSAGCECWSLIARLPSAGGKAQNNQDVPDDQARRDSPGSVHGQGGRRLGGIAEAGSRGGRQIVK